MSDDRNDNPVVTCSFIAFDSIKIQWINDWYDGPLSGVGLLDGKEVYFFADYINNDTNNITYGIYLLTAEQTLFEHTKNEDFVTLVGTYYDYRVPSEQRSYHKRDHSDFYAKYHDSEQHDLSKATFVTWARG